MEALDRVPQAYHEQDGLLTINRFEYAGLLVRYGAAIIDGFVLFIPTTAIVYMFSDGSGLFLMAILTCAYQVFMTVLHGGTVGKLVLGLQVIDEFGERPSYAQAIAREIPGKFISAAIFNLGYFWIIFNDKKQGWHDLLAKTYVIHN